MSASTGFLAAGSAGAIGERTAAVLKQLITTTRKKTRQGAPHRTGAPVRRDSLKAGTFEDGFFSVPARGEADRRYREAQLLLDRGKELKREAKRDGRELTEIERAITQLTSDTIRVFKVICDLARLCAGKVFPSQAELARQSRRGLSTVKRVLPILKRVGLIIYQRRFVIDDEGEGPRYKQTSNVYRLNMPTKLLAYLPRSMRPAPMPADEVQREADRKEAFADMLSTLSNREYVHATVSSGPLADALAALGASIEARVDRPEPES